MRAYASENHYKNRTLKTEGRGPYCWGALYAPPARKDIPQGLKPPFSPTLLSEIKLRPPSKNLADDF